MDSYRPGGDARRHHSDIDSYRPSRREDNDAPSLWRPGAPTGSNEMYHFQGNNRDQGDRNEYSYRPQPRPGFSRNDAQRRDRDRNRPPLARPFPPRTAANRPLFRLQHDEKEASSFRDRGSDSKFRNLDEMTDSDEEAMALSEDEEHERNTKRARTGEPATTVDPSPAPKWSNPDPYTALPPPATTEGTAKRTDVLKLIRKARIESSRNPGLVASADDFISFEADEPHAEDSGPILPPPESPPPPPSDSIPLPSSDSIPPPPSEPIPPPPSDSIPLPPPDSIPPTPLDSPQDRSVDVEVAEESAAVPEDKVLGKRKRGQTIGSQSPGRASRNKASGDVMVQQRWAVVQGVNPAPWLTASDGTDIPGIALHKEIIDFYHWIKPKAYEQQVRDSVFQRLSSDLQKCMPGELKAFGSYAAGLYLPTGDMDLVYFTRGYRRGQLPTKDEGRRLLSIFAKFLRTKNMAKPGSVITIPFAKVPIIKFVDRISGLKVDLCFDNDSGVAAVETFQKWKKEYPAMPIIVAIVKQFLMIRGLNDVATGGLGGFSTICLVTSLLQHMPPTKQRLNLGEVLLEFFNLYGNVFDKNSVGIRLDPPAYVDKSSYMPYAFKDKDGRLTIVDPNRPDNNISGGTRLIDNIMACFSSAHRTLLDQLNEYEQRVLHGQPQSLLECLIGGNFTLYETQRQTLLNLSTASTNVPLATAGHLPPPHPLVVNAAVPGPKKGKNKPSGGAQKESDTKMQDAPSSSESLQTPTSKKLSKGERRANRLRRLRPELASSIGKTISRQQAVTLGGYKTPEAMERDLQSREAASQKAAAKAK
ncbi:hypothetical protein HRR83_006193 [Exophiala dermatitidis]|nr:hypothetical protein HRR75_005120 [Exophiala dermatitidis]KAJ4515124.1 hypothetical protein HRR74_005589 [Exophiala dermatitidis]KAJ4517617.1 hypothetical protein HRR73_004669 [Exophiala dermatitidis]KAJ4550441.1 hypothetical protein HRR78_004210 [Exophiala dermatitidis]KAJ4552655.1 hypothetical protein HRR77_002656 [Exophiala dermatitidis]